MVRHQSEPPILAEINEKHLTVVGESRATG